MKPETQRPDAASPIVGRAVGSVTVTYNPDFDILLRQLLSLPAESPKYLVDNSADQQVSERLAALCCQIPSAFMILNTKNIGLPAALNRGLDALVERHPTITHLLLLDQDSEPQPDMVQGLLASYLVLEGAGLNPGLVGPRIIDIRRGFEHGFHCIQGWRWVRRYPAADDQRPVRCAGINCSGTLVSVLNYHRIGGLEESFFIDQLDAEWSFRASSLGLTLWGIPNACLQHRMGTETWRIWLFGWRPWPYRSPERHFFVFRNAVLLMKRPYVPLVWKFWGVLKLLLTVTVHFVADSQRRSQVSQMFQGISAGLYFREAEQ